MTNEKIKEIIQRKFSIGYLQDGKIRTESDEALCIVIETFEKMCKLESIYEEIENIELTTPKISRGYECYGIRDKTAGEIKTEILDIISKYIKGE